MKKTEIIDFLQTEAQNDMSKKTKPETKEPEPEKEANQREASDIEAEFFNK